MDDKDIKNYKDINDSLIKWGWLVSPYYSHGEINKLMHLSSKVDRLHGKKDKGQISNEIGKLILQGNLDYHFRAITVFEGYRATPNMKKFSHLFEAGLLELYRLNFIACLGIWIPIIEGILRSFLGITFGDKLDGNLLKNLKAKIPSQQSFLDTVTDVLIDFFNKVFYNRVNSLSDLSVQNLNRHFFSHTISHEPLYCMDNCLKLLNVFDTLLAIEFIVNYGFKALFNGQDERIKLREQYYEKVLRNGLSNQELLKLDLLKDHPNFDEAFYYQRRPIDDLKSRS